jgi:hypothetical protein
MLALNLMALGAESLIFHNRKIYDSDSIDPPLIQPH